MSTSEPALRPRTIAPRLLALAVFVLLAAVHTWPLARDPAHLSRNDNGNTVLNTWDIAWVAHQLPRDPVHLFDANIFYPERMTLGYSEAMIVQGVLAMPILAAGASPVLTYNLLLMGGLALTGDGLSVCSFIAGPGVGRPATSADRWPRSTRMCSCAFRTCRRSTWSSSPWRC